MKKLALSAIAALALSSTNVMAEQFKHEITPWFGHTFSDDIVSEDGASLGLTDDTHFAVSYAWQDTPNGQGMIMLYRTSHDFDKQNNMGKGQLDVTYLHFNGVAMFKDENYTTTLSIGAGGAFMEADEGSKVFPSLTVALGTRHEFQSNLALQTELRAFASLTDKSNDLFCQSDVCSAKFDSKVWTDTSFSIGLTYRF